MFPHQQLVRNDHMAHLIDRILNKIKGSLTIKQCTKPMLVFRRAFRQSQRATLLSSQMSKRFVKIGLVDRCVMAN